ncbi:hypothetical protein BDP27DRAFT_740514 [Rhodocollybia butyracea]|uniref:Uncharacterized protein n=1 Tax=Rhodocollybia butyracea TaxID=206335 RepID=A0A9P5U7W2_9AGAR|nr:hypothetical protein BDP27DRAFT_740514 [Rhodocollybia butyracea]
MTNVELEAVIKRLSRWTQVPDLGPLHQRNAQSASSLYNGHLPGTLQPKHITLAEPPQSIQQLVQPLLLRKNTKEFLLGQSGEDLGAQWLIILERVWLIMVFHGVVDAQRRVLEVVGEVAAFFLFPDLTKSQAESLGTKWRPVTPYSSTDLGSSLDADIVVGLPKVGHLKILLDLLPNREDSKVLSKFSMISSRVSRVHTHRGMQQHRGYTMSPYIFAPRPFN